MTLNETKHLIWGHRKVSRCPINLQSYADKAKVRLPITQLHEAEKLLKLLNKGAKKRTVVISDEHFKRYRDAKFNHQAKQFPNWIKDNHFIEPDRPDISTANGLQSFICEFLNWEGWRVTRINVMGRQVNGKWIKSSTRTGSSDVSSTIAGKSVMFEIKINKDKPSPAQLKEQIRERKAGGEYFFTKTVEDFFIQYDKVLSLSPVQTTLL